MKKQSWFLLLATLFTAVLLCGCSQYDGQYENTDFLTDGMNHYAALMWVGRTQKDGSYSLQTGSFSGVHTLRSFSVEKDQTLCEVTSTLTCSNGEAKLLVVDTGDDALVAQWPLDSEESMAVTLPAGDYDLRIAGKSAKMDGEIRMALNGEPMAWDGVLDTVKEMLEDVLTGTGETAVSEVIDSLQEAFDDEQNAA